MSLRRMIKTQGVHRFLKMGIALAKSRKVPVAEPPANEEKRAEKVAWTGLIGVDKSDQFEVYNDVVRLILGCDESATNMLTEDSMYAISGSNHIFDPKVGLPRQMSICQHAILTPTPTIINDFSKDTRFAGTFFTKAPMNMQFYGGFPIITSEGFAIGTLCAYHSQPLYPDAEQIRLMCNLATTLGGHIVRMAEQANFTASRLSIILGKFRAAAPEGTLEEFAGFLDFCARGTADKEALDRLKADAIIEAAGTGHQLTQSGRDLKEAIGLAPETFKGVSVGSPAEGHSLDDLLGKLG